MRTPVRSPNRPWRGRSGGLLGGDAFVTVVQTANFRAHHDGSDACLGGGPVIGRVFLEGKVGSAPVIILDVGREHAPEMPLVQDDHVIEALSADRADHTLDIWILPGTRRADTTSARPMPATRRWNTAP